jgi:DNA mismatch endonuclease (patch repair protein)
MSRIKGKDTKPEIQVRSYLHRLGLRFRLHDKKLAGKPDIVLPRYKTVIFVNGCFWHGHENCRYFTVPKTRTEWWLAKITGNCEKDVRASRELKKAGWKVITIWECDLKSGKLDKTLKKLSDKILS